MDPEERVAKEYIYILNRLKEEVITAGNNPFSFEAKETSGEGIPDRDHKTKILKTLFEQSVIQMSEFPSPWNDYVTNITTTLDQLDKEIKKWERVGDKAKVIFSNIIDENKKIALKIFREIRILENLSATEEIYYGSDEVGTCPHYLVIQFVERMAKFGLWDFLGSSDIGGDQIIRDIDTKALYKLIELLEQENESQTNQILQVQNPWDTFKETKENNFIFSVFEKSYSIEFESNDNNLRYGYFKKLFEKHGKLITINELKQNKEQTDKNIRSVITQINRQNLINKPINIISTAKGYKIVFLFPDDN